MVPINVKANNVDYSPYRELYDTIYNQRLNQQRNSLTSSLINAGAGAAEAAKGVYDIVGSVNANEKQDAIDEEDRKRNEEEYAARMEEYKRRKAIEKQNAARVNEFWNWYKNLSPDERNEYQYQELLPLIGGY